jgi:hypothetical protein
MDDDWTSVAADVPSRRRGAIARVVVSVIALSVAAASVLTWQLVSTGPTRPGAHSRGAATARALGRSRPGLPTTRPTPAPTTAPLTMPATTSSAGPLRVVEIGDSLGVDLGEAMQNTWSPTAVRLTVAARGDTGLANSGYYDWPRELVGLLASFHPELVVVLLGANDLQSMVTGSRILPDGTASWDAQYTARVKSIVAGSIRSGARVLWIGEPAMETAFINAGMTRIDGIARKVVDGYPGEATYLSSNSVLAPDGSFTFDVEVPTGQEVQVRTPDGVHLMAAGADLLAAAAAKAVEKAWGMRVTGG